MNNGLDSSEASSSSRSHSSHDRQDNSRSHLPPTAAAASPYNDNDNDGGDDDVDDLGPPDDDDRDLLGDVPLHGDLDSPISFKRKPKRGFFDFAQPSRLFTNLTGGARPNGSGASQPPPSYGADAHDDGPTYPDNLNLSPRRRGGTGAHGNLTSKDGVPLDWYVEGPGRRVGYEDLTAIDWIFEYTKERTRLRVLRSNAQGLLGKMQLAFDSAQEWLILVATGILVGTLAAIMDITTDWLGDLKTGYCTSEDGGAFYLNKSFCCMGYDEGAQCLGWRPWAQALHISSAAGKWIIEYFFFISFSVCPAGFAYVGYPGNSF